jgi:hypothetical protein
MLVFRDIVSDDDMFSDDLPYELIDDCLYEVTCTYIPSPYEPMDEYGSDNSVVDLAANFHLKHVRFARAEYRTYLKSYAETLRQVWNRDASPDTDLDDYIRKFRVAAKMVLSKLDDAEFYMGESVNEDAMVALLEYRYELDGEVPVMMFYKHGLTRMEI